MSSVALRSMTGYGEAERALEAADLRVTIRTVNHRHLNLQLRVPQGLEGLQRRFEEILREHFRRGHVQVGISLEAARDRAVARPVVADVERARAYLDALRALRDELGVEGRVDLNMIARCRDVFQEAAPDDDARTVTDETLVGAVSEAADAVLTMRIEEGARLAEDLIGRLDEMEASMKSIETRAPARLVAERDRLRNAIGALLDDDISVDEDRIAREIAHLAERWDIHEEIVRFRSHLVMFRQTVREGDVEGVGKRLGFVAQELLRETNTIGSKANDAEIARDVVRLKEEIDRLKEQVENVE